MATLIGNVLVGVALLASMVYALLALGPKSWGRRVRSALGLKVQDAKAAASCGGCEGCGSDTAAPHASAEFKIPVGKIGRR
jgi:hypothetical protein